MWLTIDHATVQLEAAIVEPRLSHTRSTFSVPVTKTLAVATSSYFSIPRMENWDSPTGRWT